MSNVTDKTMSCCDKTVNSTIFEGLYSCIICGNVLDMYTNNVDISNIITEKSDEMIQEFCERAHIDSQTCYNAVNMFNKMSSKLSTLNKTVLRGVCVYSACKQAGVPRTMGEIAGVTGCCIKQLGKYETLIKQKHYPLASENYVERFSRKLGLDFTQIKIIHEKIKRYNTMHSNINPATIACCCIYNSFPQIIDIYKISKISGVPVSSIRRLGKKNPVMRKPDKKKLLIP